MTLETRRVAVLGLGRMGAPMAACLARAGFEVRGWNRTPQARPPHPAVLCVSSAAEAIAAADAVILALSDRPAIETVLFGAETLAALPDQAVVVDMGTTGPKAALDHAARLRARGVAYLDAPVSGGVAGAEAGTLTIMAGGERPTFELCRPVFQALGQARLLGPTGAGQTAKLANQLIVAGYIAAVAEGLRFAEDQGLDGAALVEALEGGFADSAILRRHGRRMVAREFAPGGACRLHLKDLRLAADLAGDGLATLVNTAEAIRRFQNLVEGGFADADHSAYITTYEAAR